MKKKMDMTTPTVVWKLLDALIKQEQQLISALHIMQNVIDNPGDGFKEIHKNEIHEFLSKHASSE